METSQRWAERSNVPLGGHRILLHVGKQQAYQAFRARSQHDSGDLATLAASGSPRSSSERQALSPGPRPVNLRLGCKDRQVTGGDWRAQQN